MNFPTPQDLVRIELAKTRIADAERYKNQCAKDNNDYQVEIRSTIGSHYGNVSLLSGGAFILSLTLVSTFKGPDAAHPHVLYLSWLVVGWAFLLVSMVCGLFVGITHSGMMFFGMQRRHFEAVLDYQKVWRESCADGVIRVADVEAGKMTLQDHLSQLKTQMDDTENSIRQTKDSENKKRKKWQTLQWATDLAFIFGLACLAIFAVLNLLALA
jgi:hypothetical protein